MSAANEPRPLILVIDDSPQMLSLLDDLLAETYQLKVTSNGARGLAIAQTSPQPDLILLDIEMPEMDGFEVCRQLKEDPRTKLIPVIFLTAKTDQMDENKGFELGAVDYITKPVSFPIVLARVKTQLALKAAADFLRDRNGYLEQEVLRRTAEAQRRARELKEAYAIMIVAMASIAETRDNETGNHILRTQSYVRRLAEYLSTQPEFEGKFDAQTIDDLYQAAPLHDIGKVGIPDHILLKPGKLTPEEFEIMKTHTTLGFRAIQKAQDRIGVQLPVLEVAKEIALYHQEKWDGSGYPEGRSGKLIPLSARLMALADVYDALISRRVYKEPMSHEEATQIIRAGLGRHFDPVVVDAFMAIEQDFRDIALRYRDDDGK